MQTGRLTHNPATELTGNAYAQQRYQDLTGWACPHAGGPTRHTLSAEQRDKDERARLTISQELGHTRLQIVAVYCGI